MHGCVLPRSDPGLDYEEGFIQVDIQLFKYSGSHTVTFTNEAEKNMFCVEVAMVEALGFFLR